VKGEKVRAWKEAVLSGSSSEEAEETFRTAASLTTIINNPLG
jgi:hypothetical protein